MACTKKHSIKEVVIHIGSGKTGSTSIQRALYESIDTNKTIINYPIIGNNKNNQIIRFAFCKLNQAPSNIVSDFKDKDPSVFKEYQETIKRQFEEQCQNNSPIVVSSEFLFLAQLDEINHFKSYLMGLGFSSFKIIAYVRDPSKYYLSLAQQALKNSAKIPQPDTFQYGFVNAVKLWSLTFKTDVILREFSINKLDNGDVVDDFSNRLNELGYGVKLNLSQRLNESVSAEATQAMQDLYSQLRLNTLNSNQRRQLRIRMGAFIRLKAGNGSKPVLREDIETKINIRFKNNLTWINEHFGLFSEIVKTESTQVNNTTQIKSFKEIVTKFDERIYKDYKLQLAEMFEDFLN